LGATIAFLLALQVYAADSSGGDSAGVNDDSTGWKVKPYPVHAWAPFMGAIPGRRCPADRPQRIRESLTLWK
jgi:hypothetical protein